jgi:cyclohexa-1,5-dienecarbonyl-CoA hydratase
MSVPLRCSREHDGELARLVLDRPKANIVDRAMCGAIRAELGRIRAEPPVKLIVFEGAGAHFSFGASVEEHLPGQVEQMLPEFHALFRELEQLAVPTAALVRGQCLGGGLELALFCGTLICDRSARFGQPEIKLGVFPPLGSLALPWRVGGARATRLVLTGESIDGETAERWGLADRCVDDPEQALQAWFAEHLRPKSATALRYAWQAVRRPVAAALAEGLPALERLYLAELMACHDPAEGLRAFVEKRAPVWQHR